MTEYDAEYSRMRRRVANQIDRVGGWCSEPVCLMETREIGPGRPFHLSHDHDATVREGRHVFRGPAHPECNRHEKAVRLKPECLPLPQSPAVMLRQLRAQVEPRMWRWINTLGHPDFYAVVEELDTTAAYIKDWCVGVREIVG